MITNVIDLDYAPSIPPPPNTNGTLPETSSVNNKLINRNFPYNVQLNMNINARLSRSNLNLNHKQTPHFHRSYHNLNAIEQQYPTPARPPAVVATTADETILKLPQYEQQQQQAHQKNDINFLTQYATPATNIYQQQNQWFRNNDNNSLQRSTINNNNNNNNISSNSNWNQYNVYETPNFVPASFWMGAERFVYPIMKQDTSTATWQPQQEHKQQQKQQQQQQEEEQQTEQPIQRGNILDYKNQSNTIYSVYNNHNVKRHKTTTNSNNGTNGVTTTTQPMIKVRTNVQGLPYTPQPERRNTVNEQRAIQAVMPLNDTLLNKRHQTS